MDGTPNTFPNAHIANHRWLCAIVAVLLLASAEAFAKAPPTFQVQGVPQPIDRSSMDRSSDLGVGRNPVAFDAKSGSEALLVRPPARLIDAHQTMPLVVHPRVELQPRFGQSKSAVRVTSTTPGSSAPGTSSSRANTTANETTAVNRSIKTPPTVEQALQTRGSVTFRKTPLSEVVFMLSDVWHINIVAGENVSGEVSGTFHDAPLREVLSAALAATGYGYRQMGNSLIVLPMDQVGSDDPNFVTETIRIPFSLQSDDSALQAAELLLSDRGKLQRVGSAGILVVDTAPRIARIRQLFNDLTPTGSPSVGTSAPPAETITRSGIAYFSPQFTEAEEMAEPLQAALGDQVIVAVYPAENRLMVKGNPNDLRLASEAIQQLDRPRPQVRITAMIYDVALGELEQLGVNWFRDLRVNANAQNEALAEVDTAINELFRFNSDLTTSGLTSTGIITLKDTLAAAVILEALDNTTEAKLLADPSITVGDRRQASIRIVRRIPIVGANPVEGSNAVFTQTEFEEAGVILNVLPRIGRDGTIELAVQPEYSVVAEITPTGPVIDSRQADTTIRVANGQMFVLGGLRQKTIIEKVRGIPYLKDIKYVGHLFRSHDTDVRESELIVFLKPEIITPYEPGRLREQRAAAVAEEQLDRIPHAEICPMAPYCRDHNCPNHHPRPRINGGSQSLEMQEVFIDAVQLEGAVESGGTRIKIDGFEELPLPEQPTQAPPLQSPQGTAPLQKVNPQPVLQPVSDHVIDDVYPPVHIDPRVLTRAAYQ